VYVLLAKTKTFYYLYLSETRKRTKTKTMSNQNNPIAAIFPDLFEGGCFGVMYEGDYYVEKVDAGSVTIQGEYPLAFLRQMARDHNVCISTVGVTNTGDDDKIAVYVLPNPDNYSVQIKHSGQVSAGEILNHDIDVNVQDLFLYRTFPTRFALLRFAVGYIKQRGHGAVKLAGACARV